MDARKSRRNVVRRALWGLAYEEMKSRTLMQACHHAAAIYECETEWLQKCTRMVQAETLEFSRCMLSIVKVYISRHAKAKQLPELTCNSTESSSCRMHRSCKQQLSRSGRLSTPVYDCLWFYVTLQFPLPGNMRASSRPVSSPRTDMHSFLMLYMSRCAWMSEEPHAPS
jgi:hypothetical protein